MTELLTMATGFNGTNGREMTPDADYISITSGEALNP